LKLVIIFIINLLVSCFAAEIFMVTFISINCVIHPISHLHVIIFSGSGSGSSLIMARLSPLLLSKQVRLDSCTVGPICAKLRRVLDQLNQRRVARFRGEQLSALFDSIL
jgi:hypothetical protein